MKRFPISTILGLTLGILLAFGVAVSAFQSPTQAPPAGNVASPLNTGPSDQTKTGGLLQVFNLWVNSALGVTGGATFGGPVRVGRFSSKPACNADITGALVFDTINDKPYVCATGGIWKSVVVMLPPPPPKTCNTLGPACGSDVRAITPGGLDAACATYCGSFTPSRSCTFPYPCGGAGCVQNSNTCTSFNFSTCTGSGLANQSDGTPLCRVRPADTYTDDDGVTTTYSPAETTTCTCN